MNQYKVTKRIMIGENKWSKPESIEETPSEENAFNAFTNAVNDYTLAEPSYAGIKAPVIITWKDNYGKLYAQFKIT